MLTVQLNWFDDICDKVSNFVKQNIWYKISDAVSQAATWISDTWNNLIVDALEKFAKTVLNGILEIIFARFYAFQTTVLLVLDCIEDCFDVVSGISPVYRMTNGTYKPMTLLSALFAEPSIKRMMAAMIGVGMVLCIFCAILATVKSMMEMDGRQSKPVSHVLRQTAKAMLYFILVPLIATFMLSLSGAILNTIDDAFAAGKGKTTVARTIFTVASLDAIDTDKHPEAKNYNASYTGTKPDDFGVMDKYRKEFYLISDSEDMPAYANPFRVKNTFTFRGIDYVIGIGLGIYFNIVLGMVLFIFICRIFEVIVLLITEPFFIAMMPLDDGEHFKSWSSLFLGKLFGGYGMVVAMRLYLLVAGMLFSNTISFVKPGSNGATVQNYLIKLLFLAGGAMGIRAIGPLVTSILSQTAARTEQEEAAIGARYGGMVASFQGKRMGKLLMSYGGLAGNVLSSGAAAAAYGTSRAASAVGGSVKNMFSGRKSSGGGGKGNDNQYNGGVPVNPPAGAIGVNNNNKAVQDAKALANGAGQGNARDMNNLLGVGNNNPAGGNKLGGNGGNKF